MYVGPLNNTLIFMKTTGKPRSFVVQYVVPSIYYTSIYIYSYIFKKEEKDGVVTI